MYCAKCYAELEPEPYGSCPNCGKLYHIRRRKSVLKYPFPSLRTVLRHVVVTILAGSVLAFMIAHLLLSRVDGDGDAPPTAPLEGSD